MPHIAHEFLREGVEARAYQVRSLERILSFSTLMVMPTGFGKTAVQWMAMAEFLRLGAQKIILVAPTTGLVDQQATMAKERLNIDEERIVTYTGDTPPERRRERWEQATIVMATPQVIRNDAMNGTIDLSTVDLLIMDEAHHATGNHAYAQVGVLYQRQQPNGRVLAATASPGSTMRTINEVQTNLNVNNLDLSRRGEALMAPYDVDMDIHVHRLDLPEALTTLIAPLWAHFTAEVDHLKRLGFLPPKEHIGSRDIEKAQQSASRAIQQRDVRGYDAARRVADLRRLHILMNLLRTQGSTVARAFLDRAEEEGRNGRKTNRLLSLPVIHALRTTLRDVGELHPKQPLVEELVIDELNQKPDGKVLVFTEYRDSVHELVKLLKPHEGVRPDVFIGQSSRGKQKGMTQKEQLQQLDRFRSGEINVLVATSVGEEGLDVPSADLVVLYEPVPSAVRAIQRRGRTARQRAGSVHMLVANETRDAYVHRASGQQEANMHQLMDRLVRQKKLNANINVHAGVLDAFSVVEDEQTLPAKTYLDEAVAQAPPPQPPAPASLPNEKRRTPRANTTVAAPLTPAQRRPQGMKGLYDYEQRPTANPDPDNHGDVMTVVLNAADDEIQSMNPDILRQGRIAMDHRESASTLPAYLQGLGLTVHFTQLPCGDLRLSERILIERKTARDLLSSIKEGRLLRQCRSLRASAARPLLLIETGGEAAYGLHPNAVLGALAHITLDLGLPVMMVRDAKEAAHFIAVAAQRELEALERLHRFANEHAADEDLLSDRLEKARFELDLIERHPEQHHPWLDTVNEHMDRCFAHAVEPLIANRPEWKSLVMPFSPDLAALMVATPEAVSSRSGSDVETARRLLEEVRGNFTSR